MLLLIKDQLGSSWWNINEGVPSVCRVFLKKIFGPMGLVKHDDTMLSQVGSSDLILMGSSEKRTGSSVHRECSWEQTYTGSCPVDLPRAVHEVEYVFRDLFTSHGVKVRDVRAALVFAIEVLDGVEMEKYYLHVVVRGVPWIRHSEDIFNVSSSLHVQTFSAFSESALGESVRCGYTRLHTLYSTPMEGTGVWLVLLTRVSEDTVERKVLQCRDDVAGYRRGEYQCEGLVQRVVGKSRVRQKSGSKFHRRSATVTERFVGSGKRAWDSSEDEKTVKHRECFSDRVSRFKYMKLENGEDFF
jgi:hypothetical protein